MQETLRTVKYSVSDGVKFEKIALKLGRSKRLVFSQMLDYFYRSKKDPLDMNDELLKNTILKGQREYIGFIKTQEADLLIPTKREVDRLVQSHRKLLDHFNAQVIAHNLTLLENQDILVKKFSRSDEMMRVISARLDTVERLKGKFTYILENYMRVRDTFTMMTSAREREELVNKTMKQVNQL